MSLIKMLIQLLFKNLQGTTLALLKQWLAKTIWIFRKYSLTCLFSSRLFLWCSVLLCSWLVFSFCDLPWEPWGLSTRHPICIRIIFPLSVWNCLSQQRTAMIHCTFPVLMPWIWCVLGAPHPPQRHPTPHTSTPWRNCWLPTKQGTFP